MQQDDLHRQTHGMRKAPTLILMAGFAGAGKTTLARRLGYWLHWDVLSKDELKHDLLAKGEPEEQAAWDAFSELFRLLEQRVVEEKESVIVDTSNEKPFIFENVLCFLERLQRMGIDAQFFVLLCVTNKETRTQRIKKRGSVFAPYVQTLPTILDDEELPERFKHLPSDRVFIVNTSAPLRTYDWKVLRLLLPESDFGI